MLEPGSGLPRATRAAALAGLATVLAGLGHRLGGMPLDGLALLLAFLTAAPLAWAITGRRLRTAALTAALGGGQLLAHTAFVLAGGARAAVATPMTAQLAATTPASAVGSPAPAAPSGAGHVHHLAAGAGGVELGLDARMLLSHLLATLVLAVLLARGEAVLWRVWHRLLPSLPVSRTVLVVRPRVAPPCPAAAVPTGPARSPRRTRGPPAPVR